MLPRLQALFDEVYRRPDDDDARLVLSDALQEEGDPRGLFIALQFARARRTATPAMRLNEEALQAQHWRAWVPKHAELVDDEALRFDRGFLSSARVAVTASGGDDPAWSTVESLTCAPVERGSTFLRLACQRFTYYEF